MNIYKVMRNLFAINIYQSQGPRESSAVGPSRESPEARNEALQKPDAVALSEQVKQMQKLRQMLDAVPEVREDRVQALQRQVCSGTYRVSAEDLANRLLNLKQQ